MPGFLEKELSLTNSIELAKKQRISAGLPLIDLTDTNPVAHGLHFPVTLSLCKKVESYFKNRSYPVDPKGLWSARAAIARYYLSRTPPLEIPLEQIYITSSTSESYSLLFTLLADAGDAFLIPNITYPLFELLAKQGRIDLRHYKLLPDIWEIDQTSLIGSPNTRGVIIVSPHNPLGSITRDRIAKLSSLALPLIVDEVFAEFCWCSKAAPPLGSLYPELPVFHLNGISKMLALPDLKLGWIALNDCAYRLYGERLEILNDTFLSANYLTQELLSDFFEHSPPLMIKIREQITNNIEKAVTELSGLANVKIQLPEAGYFLTIKVDTDLEEDELIIRLINHGAFAYPGYFFGEMQGVNIIISTLLSPFVFNLGLAQIKKTLRTTEPGFV